MTVRDEEPGDAVAGERLEIGVHDVDPQPSVVERHAAVDEQDLAPLLERKAVHPNLTQAAQRDEAQRALGMRRGHGRLIERQERVS